MSLFQKSVEQKYLKPIDNKLITAKYNEFNAYFGNPEIQENIRNSKEEQFQEGFFRELFVKILGYTLNPNPGFNLTTEYKNIKDSKKADGAILVGESVKAVIELKGTNTTDLGKIESQAFGYKNNQPDCVYVVTSNFEKLRFYIDNAIEFIEFNLFRLTKSDFETLFLCLAYDQIAKGIPKKIKDESLSQEDAITKKLYSDYSLFKRELHQNLVLQNPQFDALTLFRKSQKLLDRFLFLFFAEDRQLLPPNSVRLVLTDWKALQERDEEIPLYNRFKKYFGYLNTGFKGKRYDVFAYNGGLFKPDKVLDSVVIDDDLLYKHALKLSEYDFASEVDVNILGHIFENSLNELDEIQAQLDGIEVDKTKTRRKKDGVFYTPKYITKYIVDNTLGRLCAEKKVELQFAEEDYITDRKRQIKTKQALLDKLKTYQNWLLQLTICDPACGSGAFLNQALDFLMAEHRYIDELQAKLLGVPMILSDVEKSILENNLFGVDLNEESVEIARLSLWLRTAQPNRKLNDLSNNIKCGNSLISDPAVAGDKAFDWEREFPQVFAREKGNTASAEGQKDETPDYLKLIKEKSLEAQTKAEQAIALSKEAAEISKKVYEYAEKLEEISDPDSTYESRKGGFDVVIGNPPYGAYLDASAKKFYQKRWKTFQGNYEIYFFFIEFVSSILKPKGKIGYITPDTWISIPQAKKLREHVLDNYGINNIIIFNHSVFSDASVNAIVFILSYKDLNDACEVINFDTGVNYAGFSSDNIKIHQIENWKKSDNKQFQVSQGVKDIEIIEKIKFISSIGEKFLDVCQGIVPYSTEHLSKDEVKNRIYHSKTKQNENFGIWIQGRSINRYSINITNEEYLNYGTWLHRPRKPKYFENERILIQEITGGNPPRISALSLKDVIYHDPGIISCLNISNLATQYLLVIINSRLISWFNLMTSPKGNRITFPKILIGDIRNFPIIEVSEEQQRPFIEKADLMLSLNKELQEASQRFQRSIQRRFNLEDLPGKLQSWYMLSYKEFIAELSKKKVKLSLSEEAEWEDYFLQEAKKALEIKTAIETTDKEIDQMVYRLYGLTDEEIRIVERI